MTHPTPQPLRAGATLALAAAAMFGVSTPFLRRFGEHTAPFTTAALLYAGAAAVSLPRGLRVATGHADAPLRRASLGRVVAVAACGAVVAPACLAWGLARTNAMLGSLLLASEALFTVVLARVFYREPIGARVACALAAIGAGSALLVTSARSVAAGGALGAIAVLVASLAWAADNALMRPLADVDPRQVVVAKSSFGALLSVGLALAASEPLPTSHTTLGLLATGAVGYGLSLRLYLMAQRRIGAGRTGSVFAAAPFLGALTAWAMGDGVASAGTVAAGALVAVGLSLHLTESHGHEHAHEGGEHEHAHRHDDGHHDHAHDPPVEGEHSHPHRHAAVRHVHPHGSDLHHQHSHE